MHLLFVYFTCFSTAFLVNHFFSGRGAGVINDRIGGLSPPSIAKNIGWTY